MAASLTSPCRLLVAQPLPGIGDMIWHLPHIRALAKLAGEPVTLLAKPRSRADEIFAAEDTVREIIWVDRNPAKSRGRNDGLAGVWRLVRALRGRRFDAAVLLHHSPTLGFAAWAAGVPVRQGYGIGAQRWFLNRPPFLTVEQWRQNRPMERASLFLRAAGIVMEQTEPRLPVASSAREAIRGRLKDAPRPFVVLGVGSSEPTRQWGAARFAALGRELLRAGWPGLVAIGGPAEAGLWRDMQAALGDDAPKVLPGLGWHLGETAALLAEAAFYVGNDTGVMNMAAAVGTRAYALFGTTPALHHSRQIVPIISPPGGPVDGVARVTLEAVVGAIRADRGMLGPAGASDHVAADR